MKKWTLLAWWACTLGICAVNISTQYPVQPRHKLYLFLFSPARVELAGHSQLSIHSDLEGQFSHDEPVMLFNQNEKGDYALTITEGQQKVLRWHLKIPREFDLSITHSEGPVTVQNISGSIDIESKNSNVELIGIQNRDKIVNVKLARGDIRLKDSRTNALLSTQGGDVTIHKLEGNPIVNSKGGDVTFREVFTGEQVVFIRNSGGKIDLSSVSNGADIINIGGDIVINTVHNFLIAKTVPGDIRVNHLKGWIKARSSGGDIHVRMRESITWTRNDISLTSLSGDITLILPPLFSMTYSAEIRGLNTLDQNFSITNEFIDPGPASDSGTAGRKRRIQGSVYGGRNQVQLVTAFGHIRIVKEPYSSPERRE